MLSLAPRTGRTHQLRVHCAAHDSALLGDRAYGGVCRVSSESGLVKDLDRIALHAAWVELPLAQPLRIQAATPAWLSDLWRDFGGADSAWERARVTPVGVDGLAVL